MITNVQNNGDDFLVQLRMKDGTEKTVSSMSINPRDVWEYTDTAFEKVMVREHENAGRAENSLAVTAITEDNGMLKNMQKQIESLKSELHEERETTRNFHNIYIKTMNEMASDMIKLDTDGQSCSFCHVFKNEFTKMQNRAEESLYRGSEGHVNSDDSLSDDATEYF